MLVRVSFRFFPVSGSFFAIIILIRTHKVLERFAAMYSTYVARVRCCKKELQSRPPGFGIFKERRPPQLPGGQNNSGTSCCSHGIHADTRPSPLFRGYPSNSHCRRPAKSIPSLTNSRKWSLTASSSAPHRVLRFSIPPAYHGVFRLQKKSQPFCDLMNQTAVMSSTIYVSSRANLHTPHHHTTPPHNY